MDFWVHQVAVKQLYYLASSVESESIQGKFGCWVVSQEHVVSLRLYFV